jgi:hypothetical protein
MIKLIRFSISAALSLFVIQFAFSSALVTYAQTGPSSVEPVVLLRVPKHVWQTNDNYGKDRAYDHRSAGACANQLAA